MNSVYWNLHVERYKEKTRDGDRNGSRRARLNGGRPCALKSLSAHLFLDALRCLGWRPDSVYPAVTIEFPQAPAPIYQP